MTIRIDFGRLFPGLVILLVGVAFFILWLLLVFISFFAFFFPGLGGIFYVALNILIASLVLMALGGLFMVAGVSGWMHQPSSGWNSSEWSTGRDLMKPGERSGEIVSIVISSFVLLFFYENQVRGTGFFTASFGPTEQALFYGTWFVGAVVSLARAAVGRRNPVRPLNVVYGALLLATALRFLSVFPFDFAHFPDLLPEDVRFAFFWLSNPIASILLVFAAIGGLVTMVYNAVVYAVKR